MNLVKDGTFEFNQNLCTHLCDELSKSKTSLDCNSTHLDSNQTIVCESRRAALVQLFFVIKQAETLVKKCLKSSDSLWPERAFTLLAMKEDVLDIILHLRWWTSILDIVIATAQKTSSSEISEAEFIESLKRVDKDFETMMKDLTSSNSKLQEAAVEDMEFLKEKIVEIKSSGNAHEPGTSEHRAYLLSMQMHSLLTDSAVRILQMHSMSTNNEGIRIPELNTFEVVKDNIGSDGGTEGVSQVNWCSYDCALKTVHVYDECFDTLRETRILRGFHHPHIVQFFGHWVSKSYFAESFFRGCDRFEGVLLG